MHITAVFLTLAAASAAPAAAGAQDSSVPQKAEKKVCKTVGEAVIGSRFGQSRVCKTPAQWKQESDKQKGRSGGTSAQGSGGR